MTLDGLAARSVAVIRDHQSGSGAYLAAPFPAAYRNAWLRDGAFVADGMSRMGERASAEAFFGWCAGVVEARAGRMTVFSSSPIAPSSPACGFSAATASRGEAMPKSLIRA